MLLDTTKGSIIAITQFWQQVKWKQAKASHDQTEIISLDKSSRDHSHTNLLLNQGGNTQANSLQVILTDHSTDHGH
jgi:hypothetical protein